MFLPLSHPPSLLLRCLRPSLWFLTGPSCRRNLSGVGGLRDRPPRVEPSSWEATEGGRQLGKGAQPVLPRARSPRIAEILMNDGRTQR